MIAGVLWFSGLLLIGLVAILLDGVRLSTARKWIIWQRRPRRLKVIARYETGNIVYLIFKPVVWLSRLPCFEPGQYLTLLAPVRSESTPLKRPYSLAQWQDRPRTYELAIKREESGVVSNWVWNYLHVGSQCSFLPPTGHFRLQNHLTELVLIGGGIGITPMRAMLTAYLQRQPCGRVLLFYAARTEAELLFHQEFEQLATQYPIFHYFPYLSRPSSAWQGRCGYLTAQAIAELVYKPATAEVYFCAGQGLTDTLLNDLPLKGFRASSIHYELFGVKTGNAKGVEVRCGNNDHFIFADEPNLLHALEVYNCAPPSECRTGSCGVCQMKLLEGQVDWLIEPSFKLTANAILPCCCLPKGRIVIT